MQDAIAKGLVLALATAPFIAACGGGGGSPTAASASQCSGSSCGTQGPPTSTPVSPLCPTEAEIAQNTYLGGAGSGEIASLRIDATSMTYTLKWLESPVPLAAGQVTPTRGRHHDHRLRHPSHRSGERGAEPLRVRAPAR